MLQRSDLYDPVKFETIRSVPCFAPHEKDVYVPGRGVVRAKITTDDLRDIAKRGKDLDQRGVFLRLTDGHVNFQNPSAPLPPLAGYASNPHLSKLPDGTPCVAYDWHVLPEHKPLLKQRPYRSAEYYAQDKLIRGVAMLLRDPALDMGTFHYDRGQLVYLYGVPAMPDLMDDTDNMTPPTAGEEALVQKVIDALMAKFPGLASLGGGAGGSPPGGLPLAPPNPMHNAMAAPALYEQRIKLLEDQLRAEQDQRDTATVMAMVQTLQAERYQLDPNREVQILKALPADKRDEHVAYIRRVYSQLPGGTRTPVMAGPVNYQAMGAPGRSAAAGTITRSQYDQITTLMDAGLSLEEAKKKVLG